MIQLVKDAGLSGTIEIDSAGTEAWHTGKGADPRSQETANKRGVHLPSRARQFKSGDFDKFHYVVAMDASNLQNLQALAPHHKPAEHLHMLREYHPANPGQFDVPDPYYGGASGFEDVYDLCEASCRELLKHIQKAHELA